LSLGAATLNVKPLGGAERLATPRRRRAENNVTRAIAQEVPFRVSAGAPVVAIVADEVFARRLRAVLASAGLEPVAVVADVGELPEIGGADVLAFAGSRQPVALHGRRALVIQILPRMSPGRLRPFLAAGAAGIVWEEDVDACLVSAVRAVFAGQLVLPADAATLVAKPSLSTREKQVLGLVVIGFSNSDIARKLHLAETTVKSHLTSSFRKLGVRTRSEAATRILDPQTGLGLGILAVTGAGFDEADL
jgi:DNA-binding NarL/FixJ family response regulator